MSPAKFLAFALASAAAMGLGVFVAVQRGAPPAPLQSGPLLQSPRPSAPFTLNDQDGKPFANAQLQGHWSLLFAGFTHCPDVCPTTLALMKQLAQRVQPREAPLGLVFLSVDPERDTPAQLKAYVNYFSPVIQGVSGARDQIDALCASLGLAYVRIPGASASDYSVDHSAALVLIDPQGRVAGYFQPPFKLDTLAGDLSGIVQGT